MFVRKLLLCWIVIIYNTPSLKAFTVISQVTFPNTCLDYCNLPSLVTAVETFDGSAIINPVVVSGLYWTTLKARILSLIIGQIVATIIFAIIGYFAASQLSEISDWVTKNASKNINQLLGTPSTTTGKNSIEKGFKVPGTIDISKLGICILIDTIGSSSELLPVIGEITDAVWAPIAAVLMRNLFYGSNVILVLEFAEEILPFTDIVPLASLCWVVDTFFVETEVARALGLGSYRNNLDDKDVIDVRSDKTED
mmetsp:Transcript_5489/g.6384  ORF Transcript_5489/g.6384 Transcript_5489/m.6384 type:complete len:253 (-) Transcript_5489:102-860(-)